MGFFRSQVTRWGEGSTPRRANLQKMADYFGCTVDDLLKDEESPAPQTDNTLTDEQREILSLYDQLPPEGKAEMLNHLRYIHSLSKKTAPGSDS